MSAKLTDSMRAELGLPPKAAAGPSRIEVELARLSGLVGKLSEAAMLANVRSQAEMDALKAIRRNTEKRAWSFAVVRDEDGNITALRAVPESGQTININVTPGEER